MNKEGHRGNEWVKAPHPLDCLFDGTDLPEPEARDQILGLCERTVSHCACLARAI
jgi:hypothetical protein